MNCSRDNIECALERSISKSDIVLEFRVAPSKILERRDVDSLSCHALATYTVPVDL